MSRIRISEEGRFEVGGRSFHIPEVFTQRALSSYRALLRPIPDIPGGTKLSAEQRASTEDYLSRRAAAGVIPGFDMNASASLSAREMNAIHRWIADNCRFPSEGRRGPRSRAAS